MRGRGGRGRGGGRKRGRGVRAQDEYVYARRHPSEYAPRELHILRLESELEASNERRARLKQIDEQTAKVALAGVVTLTLGSILFWRWRQTPIQRHLHVAVDVISEVLNKKRRISEEEYELVVSKVERDLFDRKIPDMIEAMTLEEKYKIDLTFTGYLNVLTPNIQLAKALLGVQLGVEDASYKLWLKEAMGIKENMRMTILLQRLLDAAEQSLKKQ